MNIELHKNEQKQTFTQFFVSAKFMRKALELRKDMNLNNLSIEDLDTAVNFVVEVFDNQFTSEEVYEGISYEEIIDTVFENVFMVILQGRKQPSADGKEPGKKSP